MDSSPTSLTANSLLSLEEADSLASDMFYLTGWSSLSSDADREVALITASLALTARLDLVGVGTYPGRMLTFPRTGLRDRNGYMIDPTIVPIEAKLATLTLADLYAVSDVGADNLVSALGIELIKVGSLEVDFANYSKTVTSKSGSGSTTITSPSTSSSLPASVMAFIPAWWLRDYVDASEARSFTFITV